MNRKAKLTMEAREYFVAKSNWEVAAALRLAKETARNRSLAIDEEIRSEPAVKAAEVHYSNAL